MKKYRITNTISGGNLGIYKANNEEEAYLAMIKDAGYSSISHAQKVSPKKEGEILIEEIKTIQHKSENK